MPARGSPCPPAGGWPWPGPPCPNPPSIEKRTLTPGVMASRVATVCWTHAVLASVAICDCCPSAVVMVIDESSIAATVPVIPPIRPPRPPVVAAGASARSATSVATVACDIGRGTRRGASAEAPRAARARDRDAHGCADGDHVRCRGDLLVIGGGVARGDLELAPVLRGDGDGRGVDGADGATQATARPNPPGAKPPPGC